MTPPAAVAAATDSYRSESDPIGEFLETRCVTVPGAEVQAAAIYQAYLGWASAQALRERETLSNTAFGKLLKARFPFTKRNTGTVYLGVGLLAERDEAA